MIRPDQGGAFPAHFEEVFKADDTQPGNSELMNVDGIAAYLGVSRKSIYNMAQSGTIPAVKVASAWRFPRAAIDEWLLAGAKNNLGGE